LFERLADPPSLVELAQRVGVHAVHLAQAFRRRFGITPMGFVRGHRVFRAVDLIAAGMPLARAAADVGFADQSHMTRAIGDARRAPPATLRRLMRPNLVQDPRD
jgi:transcriptional regulator GlxA family with amidase domain